MIERYYRVKRIINLVIYVKCIYYEFIIFLREIFRLLNVDSYFLFNNFIYGKYIKMYFILKGE